jgi:hypothetical protein
MSVEVTADGERACIVTVGSDSPAAVARYLSWWDAPFVVLDSPELCHEVQQLADRYAAAAEASHTPQSYTRKAEIARTRAVNETPGQTGR